MELITCQLDALRRCLAPSVRRVLRELPETLDETYERILQEIPRSNRSHTHRLLQCLAVAIRPLFVEELAEVLAVDFSKAGGIPKLNEDLRWEDASGKCKLTYLVLMCLEIFFKSLLRQKVVRHFK